jgi:adenylate cyclase
MKIPKFKSLLGKLSVLLLLPVFTILFFGGIISFLYVRNVMLNQWNEAAILKLQRAAHDIEMRLSKPIGLMEMFYDTGSGSDSQTHQEWVINRLRGLDGVVRVDTEMFAGNNKMNSHHNRPMHMENHTMMHFHHGTFSKITEPRFDANAGKKTVNLVSYLLDSKDEEIGKIEIVISFDFLITDVIRLGWWQSDMACIVDQSGNYLVHTNLFMEGRKKLGDTNDALEFQILEGMKDNSSGTFSSKGHPPELVAGFYSLDKAPWSIIMFAPGVKILRPIIRFRNLFFIGSLIIFLFILILIRLHVGKIVKKIKHLSDDAEKVAKGEYGNKIDDEGKDEIGQLLQSYNSMVTGLKERDHIRNTFGRYMDPEFAKVLMKRPEATELGGKRKEVAILMSDIRGFTSMAESLSPEATIYILNHYFSHMIRVIQKHNGIIVDFIGDAILVFFEPMNGALQGAVNNSLRCAIQMQKEMQIFNKEVKSEELPEFDMGIGIHAGEVVVGNIGSKERAKYGIVGSAVNLTQRIQEKAQGKEIIITDSVITQLKSRVPIRKTFQQKLKGLNAPLSLHVIDL